MYAISKKKEFICQHFLPHEEGMESKKHSHRYVVEVVLEGQELDENGYLVDLNAIDRAMSSIISNYSDATLNDHPDFKGLQPSAENLARAFWTRLVLEVHTPSLEEVEVRVWENEIAWASFKGSARK